MRIDILTYHCVDNHGAVLQAYALKTYLRLLGHDARIVNYSPYYKTMRYWFFPWLPIRNRRNRAALRIALRQLKTNLKNYRSYSARRRGFRAFRRTHLTGSQLALHFSPQLRKMCGEMLIVGSDQIWNASLTDNQLRPEYFGAYKGNRTRRVISYAASMGNDRVKAQHEAVFHTLLSHLDAISVREKGAVAFIESCGREAVTAVDPVFLLNASQWDALVRSSPLPKDSYILLYTHRSVKPILQYARELSQSTGLAVVCLQSAQDVSHDFDFEQNTNASPEEFLGLIKGARYVLTNTFHGTVFCTVFHKPFICFFRDMHHLRKLDLLDDLGLSDRGVQEELPVTVNIDAPIDWDAVDSKRAVLVAKSTAYLQEQIRLCQEGKNV